jgi:hypothetical protein
MPGLVCLFVLDLQAVEQLQDEVIKQQQLTRLDSNCIRDLLSSSTNSTKDSNSNGKSNKSSTNSSSSSCGIAYEDAGGSVGTVDVNARVAAINLTAYSNNTALGSVQDASTSCQQQQQQQQQHQQREHHKQYNQQQPAQPPPQQHWQEHRKQQQQLLHVQVTFEAGDAESSMQLVSCEHLECYGSC